MSDFPATGATVPELEKRISEAADVIIQYGGFDGAHHKDWVLDQALQKLLGPVLYAQVVLEFEKPDENGDSYEWEHGIAP